MKFSFSTLLILLVTVSSNQILAQKSKRFEEFKEMKMNFILKNTDLTKNEKKSFEILFENYENKYHDEVWVLKKKVKKELYQPHDTLSSENASKYINDYHCLEQLGMTIKLERNQKLLESIRPDIVIKILLKEMEFDQEMFKRLQNRSKRSLDKSKEKEEKEEKEKKK
jgi:hypothetical protein